MSEQNKALVRRAMKEVMNGRNYALVDDLAASDVIVHSPLPGNEIHGPQGIKHFYATLHEAFPDIHFTIEHQMAEGDRVATNWSARGTHTGMFQGIPPTGKQFTLAGIDIDRIVDGKVVECWPFSDDLGLLQQLGVLPPPAETNGTAHKEAVTTQEQEQTRAAWDNIAAGYDRTNTPTQMWLANEGLRRADLRQDMRFLDVAAGSGALSIPAARLGAQVLATDMSPRMLHHLTVRARNEGLNIETRVMDGHALDLEDDTFDIAGSQFGVMLFPDMPRGIRELARVTKPGGRVLMNVYGDPHQIEFFSFFVGAIQSIIPSFSGPPMDPLPLPFQLQDPKRLHQELARAGLKDISVETIIEKTQFLSGEHLWDWLVHSNPIVGAVLADLALTKEQTAMVKLALNLKLLERSGGRGPAILTNPINIGIGTK